MRARTLAPGHDLLLYDGTCRLCTGAASRLSRALPPGADARSFREPDVLRRLPGVDASRCELALQLVREDGEVFEGVEAVVQALRARWYGPVLRGYYLPGVRWVADAAYRAVARRRLHLSWPR